MMISSVEMKIIKIEMKLEQTVTYEFHNQFVSTTLFLSSALFIISDMRLPWISSWNLPFEISTLSFHEAFFLSLWFCYPMSSLWNKI